MSTADILRTALAELAVLRETDRTVSDAIKVARAEFDVTHADLLAVKSETAAKLAEAEAQVRQMTLVVYEQTGEKKPVTGASVVIRTTYSYDDADALAWAETALPTAITRKLDTKAIDKIASTGTLPFATKIETPSVQIGSDLSTYLTPEVSDVL
jgi:hypothetical protein